MRRTRNRQKRLDLRWLEKRKGKLEKRSYLLKEEYDTIVAAINEIISELNAIQEIK